MAETTSKNDKTWAMLCHLSGLSIFLGMPLGNVVLPLVIWLLKREESELVNINGKEAVNFQISMTLYLLLAGLLCLVFIGFILMPVIIIASIILVIQASIQVSEGREYHYPFSIHFIQ